MKSIKLILAALLIFVGAAAATSPFVSAAAPEESITITILHTNDLHGRFVGSDSVIGIDRIAAIYAATDNAILIDAGDTIHGLPFVSFTQGINAIRLMNAAGYTFMAPGNHDFNFGIDHLLYLEALADFEILAANLTRKADGTSVFAEYSIVTIDGVSIGFFGLAYPGTPMVTNPAGVVGLNFGDPVAAARRSVAALQAHEVDMIIAISHLGVDGTALSPVVALAVPEIDLIIDGHSHTRKDAGQWKGDVLVAQAGAHGAFLGRVDIVVSGGEIISIEASLIDHETAQAFAPHAAVAALIEEMNAELGAILNTVVAYNPVTLFGDDPEHRPALRSSEVPLGNLVADAIRWAMGADMAFVNSGGIRAHLMAGDITTGDIVAVKPFFNYAVTLEITPYILWQILEIGVSAPGHGRFPQISGFSFAFDGDAPVGERVWRVTVNGVDLDRFDNMTRLTIATNDFMAVGGDGYVMFADLPVLAEGGTIDELLIAYIRAHDISGIGIEGRITNARALGNLESAAPPALLPIPTPGQDVLYEVQEGETLWSIAFNFYGSMSSTVINRIFRANAEILRRTGGVEAGMLLLLPAQDLRDPITRPGGVLPPGSQVHLVRAGETLSSIAHTFFGDAAQWTTIFKVNRDRVRNPNLIIEGQWLVIPVRS